VSYSHFSLHTKNKEKRQTQIDFVLIVNLYFYYEARNCMRVMSCGGSESDIKKKRKAKKEFIFPN
jgi:hypothetical protein